MVSDVETILNRAEEIATKERLNSVTLGAVLCAMNDVRPELLGLLDPQARARVRDTVLEDYARTETATPIESSEVKFVLWYMHTEGFPTCGEAFAYSLLHTSTKFRKIVDGIGLYSRNIEAKLKKEIPALQ